MSKFFINRPIFAWVIAIFVIIAGVVSYYSIPREQYPSIASPAVSVQITYPGATAQSIDENVINVIENELIGIEGLDHTTTTSDNTGSGTIEAVFKPGTDINIAQVEVQNRITSAERKIPNSVRDNGIMVRKSAHSFLKVISFSVENNPNFTNEDLGDWLSRVIVPQLSRIDGVGNVQLFAAPRAMRIWLDPVKMQSLDISTLQVQQAIRSQNIYVTAGSLGASPMLVEQKTLASVSVPTILESKEDFENIVIKQGQNNEIIRLKDIARVNLGISSYVFSSMSNGKYNVDVMIEKTADGNAIATADAIDKTLQELKPSFPSGVKYNIPYDTSTFVKASISKVQKTLIEAFILVAIVMILFLHHIRYAIIPMIVVPISILGANTALLSLGMSINILTMFAMVLVIGIVVDDAIVVVENVERIMKEEGLPPKEATIKAMGQISGAIVGITLILVSVFLPMSLFQGATGNIYKQFSVVMTVSIAVSGFMALTLTPALCATILKPTTKKDEDPNLPNPNQKGNIFNRIALTFEKRFSWLSDRYVRSVTTVTKMKSLMALLYFAIIALVTVRFYFLPSGFLPNEDQNVLILISQLDNKSNIKDTEAVMKKYTDYMLSQDEVDKFTAISGYSIMGRGENYGLAFVTLKDWNERPKKSQSSFSLAQKYQMMLLQDKSALSFIVNPPAIPELGMSDQLEIVIQDRAELGYDALEKARLAVMGTMMSPQYANKVTSPQPNGKAKHTVMKINIDKDLMTGNNVQLQSVQHALATYLGSLYVNDFPYKGKMQPVIVQADADARKNAEDAMNLNIPNQYGKQIPLSTFATYEWTSEAAEVRRYNGFNSLSLKFRPVNGSGTAIKAMEEIATLSLPKGFGYEWTGIASDEKKSGNESTLLYLLSMIAVFLCLAALYESWSLPLAVILVIPLGIFGIIVGAYLKGLPNDIYFKIGMITIMGLSAKNAILIVEFAKDLYEEGRTPIEAAIEAARLRFRPIIMTSFAFIAGVIPLMLSSGASSGAQREIGSVVFFGMLIGTFLAIYFVPSFYVLVQRNHKQDEKTNNDKQFENVGN
ncbi:multidrug efflux RND transporter permease subunit [Neisseriaceae bacterium PsAf]|nr:multidrug efflux RND transporter permease subunit [Neisseriaceae bacterium PsAf]